MGVYKSKSAHRLSKLSKMLMMEDLRIQNKIPNEGWGAEMGKGFIKNSPKMLKMQSVPFVSKNGPKCL